MLAPVDEAPLDKAGAGLGAPVLLLVLDADVLVKIEAVDDAAGVVLVPAGNCAGGFDAKGAAEGLDVALAMLLELGAGALLELVADDDAADVVLAAAGDCAGGKNVANGDAVAGAGVLATLLVAGIDADTLLADEEDVAALLELTGLAAIYTDGGAGG